MMFSASSRTGCLTTLTSGLSSWIVSAAESTFGWPTRSVVWMTWRWRLERSTTSLSTMPSVPDAGGGEVERGRRAEPARAEQQHLGVEQLLLALGADLGEEQVARVAVALLGGQRARDLDVVAAVLPQRDAALERLDVLVAEVLAQRAGRVGGAVARRAVEDDVLVAIGDDALDARLEVAARDVDRAGDLPGRDLVALADVDDHRGVAVPARELVAQLGRLDLADLALDGAEQLGTGGHEGGNS